MLPKKPSKTFNALGINIYGGGFTLGVQDHFNVVGQWEECDLGRRTFDMNFTGIDRPLQHEAWPVSDFEGQIPFVYANPPCAPWSVANNHAGKTVQSRFEDKRLVLTEHTYKAAMKVRPLVFISESVEAGYNTGWSFYEPYVAQWMALGYAVTVFLTDAILHGSPSKRRRFHFIAHRVKLVGLPNDPEWIWDENLTQDYHPGLNGKAFKLYTVRDAIGDLVDNVGDPNFLQHEHRVTNYDEILPYTKPGGRVCDAIKEHSAWYTGPKVTFLSKRLIWDRPGATMVGFNFVHPDGERFLTVREAMRMCTYPDSFVCHNAVEAVDAVLPTVARFLAKIAKDSIMEMQRCEPKLHIIDWRPYGRPYAMNGKGVM